MVKLCVVLLVLCSTVSTVFTCPVGEPAPRDEVRLLKDKPPVYITFERAGERKPLEERESNRGIWLRLHNNTRWSIRIAVFGLPHFVFLQKDAKEVGIYYEVEEIDRSGTGTFTRTPDKPTERPKKPTIPVGYRRGHLAQIVQIPSGNSVVFSVP